MSRVAEPSSSPLSAANTAGTNDEPCAIKTLPTDVLKHLVYFMDIRSIGGARRAVPDLRSVVDGLLDVDITTINALQTLSDKNASVPIQSNPQPQLWRLDSNTVYATSLNKLRAIARDSTTPTETLGRWENRALKGLASIADLRVKQNVADHPDTSSMVLGFWENDALRGLASESHCSIRSRVAGHNKTSVQVLGCTIEGELRGLAADNCYHVRVKVASNPKTSKAILAMLATDPHEAVRAAVARNPNTDKTTQIRLASDRSPDVRRALAASAHTYREAFEILQHDDDFGVLLALCNNRATPPDILKRKAGLFNAIPLKQAVASNPSMPPGCLYQMAKFALDERTKNAARNNPSCSNLSDNTQLLPNAFSAALHNLSDLPRALTSIDCQSLAVQHSTAIVRAALVPNNTYLRRRRGFGHIGLGTLVKAMSNLRSIHLTIGRDEILYQQPM